MLMHDQLKKIGLLDSEIKVYLYLLEYGISTPPQIAKGTGIMRTNCYNVLQGLTSKDLVTEQLQGVRKAYLARDPQALFLSLEDKKETVQQILPDLRALYTTQKNKPKIRYYNGFEEVKNIYFDSLSSRKIYGIGSTNFLSNLAPDFFNKYLKQVKNRGIFFYDILAASSKIKSASEIKSALKILYEAKFLPSEYDDQPTDILIWDNNIALITLEAPIFGIIITSPFISKTLTIMFDVLWKHLSK